jgi:hypothetical protein
MLGEVGFLEDVGDVADDDGRGRRGNGRQTEDREEQERDGGDGSVEHGRLKAGGTVGATWEKSGKRI